MHNQECAILVTAYNRPFYFSKCLDALERNKEALTMPCIFALDGGPGSTQREHSSLIHKSKLKSPIILARERNYGCAKNHLDAYRFVFEWCRFKKIIMIQEDIIISPTYVKFLLNAHAWATKKYTNIGAVHGFSYCFSSLGKKKAQANLLAEDNIYWIFRTFCMDSTAWQIIKPIMHTYESYVDCIPLDSAHARMRTKPDLAPVSKKIRKWMRTLIKHKKQKVQKGSLESLYSDHFLNIFLRDETYVNEDNLMAFAFFMNDLVKLRSIVNRAITIGKYGISKASEIELAAIENSMKLDVIDSDELMNEFVLIKQKHHFMVSPFKDKK